MRPAIENPFERVVVTELQIKSEKGGLLSDLEPVRKRNSMELR